MSYFFCKAKQRTGESVYNFNFIVKASNQVEAKQKAWEHVKEYHGDITNVNEELKEVECDYGTTVFNYEDDCVEISDEVGKELHDKGLMYSY